MNIRNCIVVCALLVGCSTEEGDPQLSETAASIPRQELAEILLKAACENSQFCYQRDADGVGHGPIDDGHASACMRENVKAYCEDHACGSLSGVSIDAALACADVSAMNGCLLTELPACYYEMLGL